jgi:hypothetical protein
MSFVAKFLKEWHGHRPDTYQYLDELQAELLIKQGIAELVAVSASIKSWPMSENSTPQSLKPFITSLNSKNYVFLIYNTRKRTRDRC